MESIIKEKILKNALDPIPKEDIIRIYNLMETCVCKIHKNNEYGTGFFIKINYKSNLMPVLITNNHVLSKKDLIINESITISLNNENEFKQLKIDDSRLYFTDKERDITIIEIKEERDNINTFLELDDKLNNEYELYKDIYLKNSVYIINYPKGNNLKLSFGSIANIKKEKIKHTCSTESGSSGSPILLLNNNKVIGIHIGSYKEDTKNFNIGLFIKSFIDEISENDDLRIKPTKFNKKFENQIQEKDNVIKEKYKKENPLKIKEKKYNEIKTNRMILKYDIKQNDKNVKIFGKKFVENNRKKCKIYVEGIVQELREIVSVNEYMRNKRHLTVELIEIETIIDMSYLFGGDYFDGCKSLISIEELDNWNTIKITNMSHIFNNCESLSFLPDISKWNTSNVTDMNTMFGSCISISYLPDISKWDTSNVENMSYMFQNCKSLEYLPDISKWDIRRVTKMNRMFDGCNNFEVPKKFKRNIFTFFKDIFNYV